MKQFTNMDTNVQALLTTVMDSMDGTGTETELIEAIIVEVDSMTMEQEQDVRDYVAKLLGCTTDGPERDRLLLTAYTLQELYTA